MNTTTIHFVQDNHQISTGQTNAYSWSPSVDNMSIPIQQIHYVEPNLTLFSNNSSTKLIQMNNLEISSSINQTHSSGNLMNLLPNEEMTYLAPLINVTLSEPTVNKLLPISIEPINSVEYSNQQVTHYDHCDNPTNLSNNSALPSMAASFGSPMVVQQANCEQNVNQRVNRNVNENKNINQINNQSNSSNKQVKTKSNNAKTTDWTNCSKPGRRANKLSEQKMKYTNEFNLNDLSKVIKKSKQRKQRVTINLINQNKINLSNAPNNLCNLNSIYSPSLNNSIDSSNSLASMSSNGTLIDSKANQVINSAEDHLKSTNFTKKVKQSFSDQPESVKRRNLRERQRVTQLNNGFQRLKSKLPNSSKKMSKVQTLREAANYIRFLDRLLGNNQMVNNQSINYLNNENSCSIEFKNQMDPCKSDLNKLNKLQMRTESNSQSIQSINYYNLDNRY